MGTGIGIGMGSGMGTGMGSGMGTASGMGIGMGTEVATEVPTEVAMEVGARTGMSTIIKKTSFKKRICCEKYNLYFVGLTDRKLCVSTKYKLQKTNVVNYLKKQLSREMSKLLKFNVRFIH